MLLSFDEKKEWEHHDGIRMNSLSWIQSEINVHKQWKKKINANWNQIGAQTKSWETHTYMSHHGLNLARILTLPPMVDNNENYIEITQIPKIPKSESQN